jgi:hypothetical protein
MPDPPEAPEGWLPPVAPGGREPPRFDEPAPTGPPRFEPPSGSPPAPDAPTFTRERPRDAGRRRGDPVAVASIALGSAGLAMLVVSAGLAFFFSLPCSIAAWLLGTRARARIADGRSQGSPGVARAGRIIGLAGVALAVVAMVVWIVLILSGFSVADFQEDLERELERRRREG